MLRALIVDDEYMAIDQLEEALIQNCPEITSLKSLQSPLEAADHLKEHSVDLLFLDVEMPEMNAFEFIDMVGLDSLPTLIFTSAYSQYAVKAFKVHALDYLLKPIDGNELKVAVKKARGQQPTQQLSSLIQNPPEGFSDRLPLAEGQSYHFVKISDIIRIEGSGSYSDFHLIESRKITTSRPLNSYETRLQNQGFIRPHQSHMVNMHCIESYSMAEGAELLLINKDRVPVSTRRKNYVREKLGLK